MSHHDVPRTLEITRQYLRVARDVADIMMFENPYKKSKMCKYTYKCIALNSRVDVGVPGTSVYTPSGLDATNSGAKFGVVCNLYKTMSTDLQHDTWC